MRLSTLSRTAVFLCISACLLSWATPIGATEEDPQAPRPDFLFRYLRQQREKSRGRNMFLCGFEDDPCIPGTQHCCGGMVCRNKFNSVCLYPLESCFCTIGNPK